MLSYSKEVNNIKPKEDKGYLLSFLLDALLAVIGIYGALVYSPLIGVMMIFIWFLLEWRRSKIRKKYSPLIIYPAAPFIYVAILSAIGIIAFIGVIYAQGLASQVFLNSLGIAVLIVWIYVAFRIFRYQKSKAKINRLMQAEKKAAEKNVAKKPVKKASKKPAKKKASKKKASKKN